jgi:hypothetical protein
MTGFYHDLAVTPETLLLFDSARKLDPIAPDRWATFWQTRWGEPDLEPESGAKVGG